MTPAPPPDAPRDRRSGRLRRWVGLVARATLFLASLAAVVLWAASHHVQVSLGRVDERPSAMIVPANDTVSAQNGWLIFFRVPRASFAGPPVETGPHDWSFEFERAGPPVDFQPFDGPLTGSGRRFGTVRVNHGPFGPDPTTSGPLVEVYVRLWPAALLGSLVLAWQARRLWLARRRDRAGRCAGCGYDLRATPDRCPECGLVPSPGTPGEG